MMLVQRMSKIIRGKSQLTSTQEAFNSNTQKDERQSKRSSNTSKCDLIGLSNYPLISNIKVKRNQDHAERILQ